MELIMRPYGNDGGAVVKDPEDRSYYHIGPAEAFLLERLDGSQTRGDVCREFESKFGDSLSSEELNDFVEVARSQGFLEDASRKRSKKGFSFSAGSLLYWRKPIIDPDTMLAWLEPRLAFVFTRSFVVLASCAIAVAATLFWLHSSEVLRSIPLTLRTAFLVWLTVGVTTTLHEFAHGLVCKHHGGEVREIGFLVMFFMPCFYCDVSDAWLFKERHKRLWVTAAGTLCDLCLWAAAVLIWRVAQPGTMLSVIAALATSICGVRVFFNAIPLLKLDGYYFVSDLLELPNLRTRAFDSVAQHARWTLWGADRPEKQPRGRTILLIGLATWGFSTFFLTLAVVSMIRGFGQRWGLAGVGSALFLGWMSLPAMFDGFLGDEFMKMWKFRPTRTMIWITLLVGGALVLAFVPMHERAVGQFRVRPSMRAEVRSPIPGFLQAVQAAEGENLEAGATLVWLDVPDLSSKISQKEAEIGEACAKLKLLESGPRKEEIEEQRSKTLRCKQWRDLAEQDLGRKRIALKEELARLKALVRQHEAERENARQNLEQSRGLFEKKALPFDQVREWEKRHQIAEAQVKAAEAQFAERIAVSNQDAEAELAKREKEWADARSTLSLLEIGTRPEEIEAQRAHANRLREEIAYLRNQKSKLKVVSSISGCMITPYLKEKIGQFFKEGDLICEIENRNEVEIEISLPEQEYALVEVGQKVNLKARGLPFQSLAAHVERLAPAPIKIEKPDTSAQPTGTSNNFTVYCKLDSEGVTLRPGMTGYARIYCDQHSMGQ
ncbi:MAG: HlyD family efflux transporter periplasmic adaptor subunit, partial [Gemmataceae bacterium]